MDAIEVKNLTRRYSSGRGVFSVSLRVKEGEFFGLVGPNGAGKTTLIECIEGLRVPDEGEVFVFGVSSQKKEVKGFFGAQLQEQVPFSRMRVEELLFLFSIAYEKSFSVNELLAMVELQEERRMFYEHLSGGQKQRLRLAIALAGRPKLVFLDEPTTGLDPHSRRMFWDLLRKLRQELGLTLFLTSHYMEEVEVLCDRIGVLVAGKLVAVGSPSDIVSQYGSTLFVRVVVEKEKMLERLSSLSCVMAVKKQRGTEGVFHILSREMFLQELGKLLTEGNIRVYDLEFDSGSLEDVVVEIAAGGSYEK
ncbi:MAG: ABC transporter ATP-binding protein [Brevinematales bacterium]